jgi:FAD:protein FMN transferase
MKNRNKIPTGKAAGRLIIALVAAILITALIRTISQPDEVSIDSGHRQVMGTFARIIAVAADRKTALAAIESAFEKFSQVDSMMSSYKPDSQLSAVNRDAFDKPVTVNSQLFEVISSAVEYSQKSAGAFDITIGPLTDLWRQTADTGQRPSKKAIAEAHSKVGFEKLILNDENMTVRFAVDGMRLDLGGIAKGYAIDLAVEAARKAGARGAMIDVGGDIRCFGKSAGEKEKWTIGLQDPDAEGQILLKLKMNDAAVATSGHYRRFVLIDGERHSHIINPAGGNSAGKLASVSIIAPTAMAADALATAVSVMGTEGGMKMIEDTEKTEAILIEPGKNDYIYTSGAEIFTIK